MINQRIGSKEARSYEMIHFALTKMTKTSNTPLGNPQWLHPALLVCVLALAGCGGGGESTVTVPIINPPIINPPVATPCSLTAETGDIAQGALDQLNRYRSAVFGSSVSSVLSKDTNLVKAAGNHSNYLSLLASSSPRTHDEASSNPCFTGMNILDRVVATGNTDALVAENFSETSIATAVVKNDPILAASAGASILNGLFDAVYHRMSLLSNLTHAGVAWQTSTVANLPPTILTVVLSRRGSAASYSNLITYPYSGQTSVLLDWRVDESPCPLGCNKTGDLVGLPISIQTDGRRLEISSFTVSSTSGNVAGTVLTATAGRSYAADQNLVAENAFDRAAFIPTAPLLPNKTYTVSVVGTKGGVAFNQSWAFTTLALTPLAISSSKSTVAVGETFDVTFTGGSQNYNVSESLKWSITFRSDASPISLPIAQLAPNRYRFTYTGQCTILTGCPATFTGKDTNNNTATALVTLMP
jgi:uncharacterized protein YkwD